VFCRDGYRAAKIGCERGPGERTRVLSPGPRSHPIFIRQDDAASGPARRRSARAASENLRPVCCVSTSISMKPFRTLGALALPLLLLAAVRSPAAPSPDSMPQQGVPKGEVLKFTFDKSKVFPGTTRDYWVYVPVQYNPQKPACVYVNQDGLSWNAPTVFDNLIHKKEMPVTIGVFVMHGRVPAPNPNALDRFNRSYEYDGLGDAYARFLIDELLPEVETKKASDGRPLHLSHDGNDHAIGGASSGAIAAFTTAWERPDQFSRVWSAIGTYVGLRGGDRFPTLIRKYEPKPLRIFLQDGSNDLNIYAGDWWMANQMMERALRFSGYEVEHVWGEGGHNGQQGTEIFPDVMRYLWKGWPEPVKTGRTGNGFLSEILLPGESWQPATRGFTATTNLASGAKGGVYFAEGLSGQGYVIGPDGKSGEAGARQKLVRAQAFGPDGRLYSLAADGKLRVRTPEGKVSVLASGIDGIDLTVASSGNVYAATAGPGGKVVLVRPNGQKQTVATLPYTSGLALSPDQTLLYVSGDSHWVYSSQVAPDGTLRHTQKYYWLHAPDDSNDSAAAGMCVDRDGRLYVGTNLGVQVCDQAGRVNCILPTPGASVSSLTFGGPNGDTLFARCQHQVFMRKLKVKGTHGWEPPNKPAAPRL
jgi:gluconolactonase